MVDVLAASLVAAAKASNSGASDLEVAIISASSAIAGALLGGLVTGWVTLKAEDKRQAFARQAEADKREVEADRERTVIRGAARTWRTRFIQTIASYAEMPKSREWLSFEIPPLPASEDRKLVAAACTDSEWREIDRAEGGIAIIESLRADRAFEDRDALMVMDVLSFARAAVRELSRIAATDPDPFGGSQRGRS